MPPVTCRNLHRYHRVDYKKTRTQKLLKRCCCSSFFDNGVVSDAPQSERINLDFRSSAT